MTILLEVMQRNGLRPIYPRAGSLCWAGAFNACFWIDPTKRVTGTIMTQVMPFADDTSLKLYAEFERGVYDELKSA